MEFQKKPRENTILEEVKNKLAQSDECIGKWIKTNRSEFYWIDFDMVQYVQSMDHYCKIFLANRSHPLVMKANLKSDISDVLLPKNQVFFRINRSCIINLKRIHRIEGSRLIFDAMDRSNNRMFIVSQHAKQKLFKQLKIFH